MVIILLLGRDKYPLQKVQIFYLTRAVVVFKKKDLAIYLYGGTSAVTSKILPFLQETLLDCAPVRAINKNLYLLLF